MSVNEEPEVVTINFANINQGALIEGFDIELDKVLKNIADSNTIATATRELTLKVVFKPQADRIVIQTEVHCTSKISPIEKHVGKMFLGKSEDGGLVACDSDPRQMSLWKSPKVKETEPPIVFSKKG